MWKELGHGDEMKTESFHMLLDISVILQAAYLTSFKCSFLAKFEAWEDWSFIFSSYTILLERYLFPVYLCCYQCTHILTWLQAQEMLALVMSQMIGN